ncbi:MAG: hypothetical protein CMC70_05205 [Flavobacteriaceae bacterium]|nr:hypothetical protein [Flavobacteriaceae bacterium]|tara:strand:- start:304 stop:540 length:237 start_codon:yes stop_codon:yes gene_type:complete
MERVKLIWDFKGPNAEPIAAHHAKHLEEFAASEGLQNTLCETQKVSEMHHIAYLVVERNYMNDLRERLKPNRGQLYTE